MESPRDARAAWRQARAHITETEQACLEGAMDVQERQSALEAKQQRLNAIRAEIHCKQHIKQQHDLWCNEYRKTILDTQKALQEERKQSCELRQVWKEVYKAIDEKRDSITRQQAAFSNELEQRAAFSKELEQFEFYNNEVAAFLGPVGPRLEACHAMESMALSTAMEV